MTAATADPVSGQRGFSSLYRRQLDSYPDNGRRVLYLALTVLATVTLYYELYVGGSVSTLLLANLHMSFTFFVLTLAFGNLLGAFGSLFAGLTDRYGRANLVVFGLLATGIIVAFILPTATNRWSYTIYCFVVGVVEGMCLVATPGPIRDVSPRPHDQLMVSVRDGALIEARAKGLDVESLLHRPFRQLLKVDVVVSSLAISIFLLIYSSAVAFLVTYLGF